MFISAFFHPHISTDFVSRSQSPFVCFAAMVVIFGARQLFNEIHS